MEMGHDSQMASAKSDAKEYLKFAGVIIGIFLISWYLQRQFGDSTESWMRYFMGTFFVVFAAFKFVGYRMFVEMFAGYDIVAKKFKPYSYLYPFIELGLGILYLADLVPAARDIITLVVMAVGTIGVFQEIYHRRSGIYCACLGNVIKLPLSTVSLVEDVSMAVMAAIMLTIK